MTTIDPSAEPELDDFEDDEEDDEEDERIQDMFDRLRESDGIERVGNVLVDIAGAIKRQVACADGLCMKDKKLKRLAGKTCCTTFRVVVERDDIERVSKCVDEVRKIRDVNDAIEKADGWWQVEDDGEILLSDRPSGACVFLSAPAGDRPWCTIHEWATNNGHDFRKYKPETCCLFPLYLLECGDEVLVTSYGSELMKEADPEEYDDIHLFDCLHPPEGLGTSILTEQHDELAYRLGAKRWKKVLKQLRRRGHRV